jgi:hypothetical protein
MTLPEAAGEPEKRGGNGVEFLYSNSYLDVTYIEVMENYLFFD